MNKLTAKNDNLGDSIRCTICNSISFPTMYLGTLIIYHCPSCNHKLSEFHKEERKNIYDASYFEIQHANWFDNPDVKLFRRIESLLSSKYGRMARIIDIGCGNGNFLNYLKIKGYGNLHGLDIIDQKLPGIVYIQESIESYHVTEPFHLVVSLANIEHITDVKGYMRKLVRLLAPDGLLIIETVDNTILIYTLANMAYQFGICFPAERLYASHHVNHFSIKSLNILGSFCGLTRIDFLTKNIPLKCIDLPASNYAPLLRIIIPFIHAASSLVGREMLQIAVFAHSK